ncbi:YceI family protein [Amycolatopsis pithecellobii]|nr:YceI family protein [Amycolatopsis pithecellobii]
MTVVVPPAGRYVVDPGRSEITFTAKHQFGLGTVRGGFSLRTAEITVTDPPASSAVRVSVDATSFDSGHKGRDGKVKSKTFLDVERHPEIAFESTGVTVDSAGNWTVRGILTARGEKAPVELAVVDAKTAGTELTLTATTVVDRYAHGITAMKGMAGRHLHLTAQVRAHRQGA